MYIYSLLKHYFRNGVSAYVYWNIALNSTQESTWGWKQNSLLTIDNGKVTYNSEFYIMKHFSHFVKRGAKLLEVKGMWSPNSVAFVNPDNSKIVVVMNPFDEEKCISIEGSNFILKAKSVNTIVI